MTGDEMRYAYAPNAPVTIRVEDALRAVQACSAAARPQYINPRAAEAYLGTLARIVESIEDESRHTPALDNTLIGDMLAALEVVEGRWTELHGVDAFVRDWPEVQRVLSRYRDDLTEASTTGRCGREPIMSDGDAHEALDAVYLERREKIATHLLAAQMSNLESGSADKYILADIAVHAADALIAVVDASRRER